MEDYSKIDVTEMFHTYETDFGKCMGSAEDVIRKANGMATVNPNNKTVYNVISEADEMLKNAQD